MQLRKRKQVSYEEGRETTVEKTRSASVDEISDDSSMDGDVAVVCKPTKRVPAPAKSRRGKNLQSTGSIRKFAVQDVVNTADSISSHSEVNSDDDDAFESPPAKRHKHESQALRRSGRSLKIDYKEVSSDDEGEDAKQSREIVIPDSDDENLRKASSDSESDFETEPKRNVQTQRSTSDAQNVGKLKPDSNAGGRPKRACTLKHLHEVKFARQTEGSADFGKSKQDAEPLAEKLKDDQGLVTYTVDRYGLLVDGKYPPPVKSLKQAEKILAVRDRSSVSALYLVKEFNKSYRNAVYATEGVLQKCCPLLLRNFQKRMTSLGRVDGHTGNVEDAPAFDPQYLMIDRIIASEHRGRTRKYYVKWKGLPYAEATWESEECITAEKDVLHKFVARSQLAGHPCDISARFKDGRVLRDYQRDGVAWLYQNFLLKRNCILADEMGLGKTIQSVAMLENLRYKRKSKGPFLIVAPVSTLGHWKRELESLTDMNCVVYMGSQEDRTIIQTYEFWIPKSSSPKFTVLLSSFEILLKDRSFIGKISWQYVIVDEAHRLKSRESKTSCALSGLEIRQGGLLLLTGTPIQNNTRELFGLLNFLDPDEFDSEDVFMEKFGKIKDIEQVKDLQENILKPRLLRRMKEDVEKTIPLKEETIVWVELTKEQRAYYRAIYENRISDLLKGSQSSNLPNLRNMAMELRKLCNHPFLCDGLEEDFDSKYSNVTNSNLVQSSGKMILLDKLLPMLREANRRVLIFSQFTMMLDILEDYLSSEGYSYERIDGKIRGSERQAAIDRYSANDSKTFAFLLSTRAGGLGITLTAADTCIIYDSDWNPQNDLQAMARCHRIGQTKDVKIYRLITRNTYEQHLFECSSRKYGLDEAVLGKFEDGQPEVTKNIESLLRHGAYDILKEDGEAEAAAFGAENINHILEQRTLKRAIGGRGNNTFSVATFVAVENPSADFTDDPDLKADEFWKNLLPEAYEQKDQGLGKRIAGGRRNRKNINYGEEGQDSDDPDDDDETKAQDAGRQNVDTFWTSQELKRLEGSLSMYGTLQTTDVLQKAGLEHRSISEVKEVIDAVVQLCHYVQAKQSGTKPILPLTAERALNSDSFMQRLERKATKYLQIFHERRVIKDALDQKDLFIGLPRSSKLPLWWGEVQDVDLLRGVHWHGHRNFRKIRDDPRLSFASAHNGNVEEGAAASDDWPSDCVLSGRIKNFVKLLPGGLTETEMEKKSFKFQGKRKSDTSHESPVLKQSSRQKRVLSERPDGGRPATLALVQESQCLNYVEESDEELGCKDNKISISKGGHKSPLTVIKHESQPTGSNKENEVPGSCSKKNPGSKQQSLLGYFQPRVRC